MSKTQQIYADQTSEMKEAEIGWLPVEWEVVTLGETRKIITGSTPSTKKKEYSGNKYISPGDIYKNKYIINDH